MTTVAVPQPDRFSHVTGVTPATPTSRQLRRVRRSIGFANLRTALADVLTPGPPTPKRDHLTADAVRLLASQTDQR